MSFIAHHSILISDPASPKRSITLYNSDRCLSIVELSILDSQTLLDVKLLNRIDRFSAFALIAANPLISVAKRLYEADRIGIVVGNMFGGWNYGQRELDNLHNSGFHKFSPYQATAWFPAAAQGELTIFYGIKGYAKTLSGGLLCGLEALSIADDAIQLNKVEAVVVGVAESVVTSFGLHGVGNCNSKHLGEGACFFLLTRDKLDSSDVKLSISEVHNGKSGYYTSNLAETEKTAQDYDPFYLGLQPMLDISGARSEFIKSKEQMMRMNITSEARGFEVTLET